MSKEVKIEKHEEINNWQRILLFLCEDLVEFNVSLLQKLSKLHQHPEIFKLYELPN